MVNGSLPGQAANNEPSTASPTTSSSMKLSQATVEIAANPNTNFQELH